MRLIVQYGNIDLQFSGWEMIRTQIMEWHHSLLGISLFFGMLIILEKTEVKRNTVINYLDKYSYSIYLVHQIFILNTFSLLHITGYVAINLLIIIAVVCCMAVILEKVSDRLRRFVVTVSRG